ncbi:hypothetical protein [Streptantibioticus parmotrematis]|uniref:hypothetical protein n=1 Tax=Streptantibioticus parmotrematis TaxID=2873249 RepID=UPI00207BE813|nr:hypothetical protein [Streptantibioticus parmotrematis]
MSGDYSYQVHRLESQNDEIEHELRSKLGDVEDLDYELHDIRGDIRSVEDDLSSVSSNLSELDDDLRNHIRDTGQALKRLTGRVQALEAHLLAAGGAPHADLDTLDPQWKKLARTANHGWHVRSGLLSPHQRDIHHSHIREHNHALQQRDEHRVKAVEAARTLASQPPTSREFQQASRISPPPAAWRSTTSNAPTNWPTAPRPPRRSSTRTTCCARRKHR